MLRLLFFLALLFAVVFGLHRLRALSGEVAVTVGDSVYAVDLTITIIGLLAAMLVIVGIGWFIREVMRSPYRFVLGRRRRNEERGRQAVSEGLLAVAAGDVRAAERAAGEAARRVPALPLTALLRAQAAQLKGDRAAAREIFQEMTGQPATRIAGLRGLHIEAEREGEHEAARLIAERAREEAPSTPWASRALLRHQTADGDWEGALRTLSGATEARILDKRTARRLRAVLLTGQARAGEEASPDAARAAALEAHDLAPDLVPAAVVAGRLLSRQGDIRRAVRVLEKGWKAAPHPEIADAYMHVRSGDAASDRLKRAETLLRLRNHDDGRHAVARAAIDARDFDRAREVLRPVLTERPTRKALILMSELEAAESGDSGRARGWLARAVHAPRDPAWTADGVILETWAPVSPVSGLLDAVEWKVPLAEIEPPLVIEASELSPPALPIPAGIAMAAEAGAPSASSPEERIEERPAAAVGEADKVAPSQQERRIGIASAVEPPVAAGETPTETVTPPVPDDPGVAEEEEADETLRRLRAI